MSENFLSRWSRRKQEATEQETDGEEDGDKTQPPEEKLDAAASMPVAPAGQAVPATTGAPFDLTRLPSIESIDAGTDIRAFLQPGVPAELTRAALRRAWEADPAIREFVGLAENDWNFNDPASIPGFASSVSPEDVKTLLARVIREIQPQSSDTESAAARPLPQPAPTLEETPSLPADEADHQAAKRRKKLKGMM